MRRNTMYKTIWASLIGFVWIAAFAGISRACTSTPVADIADEDEKKYV